MGKIKLLLYCTKSKPYLIGRKDALYKYYLDKGGKDSNMDARDFIHNGKIVAECDFEVEEIKLTPFLSDKETYINEKELLEKSCLSYRELADYIGGKGYAIHIKNLHIFDKPKGLWHYETQEIKTIREAPQNMMYAYGILTGDKYILISIRPEWLCKILNGEKTIEVRKKVLKEMINNA